MIFLSFTHLKSCYYMLIACLIFILIIQVLKTIFLFNKNPLLVKNVFTFIFTLIGGFIFIVFTNLFNFGEYNIVLIISYVLIFYFADKRLCKLVDFFSSKVYHIYNLIFKWGKFSIAKKFRSIQD